MSNLQFELIQHVELGVVGMITGDRILNLPRFDSPSKRNILEIQLKGKRVLFKSTVKDCQELLRQHPPKNAAARVRTRKLMSGIIRKELVGQSSALACTI